MKKIILLLTFVALWSCGSDDAPVPVNNNPVSENPILGVWKTVSLTFNNQTTATSVDCNTAVNGMTPDITVYEFKANGTASSWNMCDPGTPDLYSYSVADNIVTMTTPQNLILKANIVPLADNQVRLVFFWDSVQGDITGSNIVLQKTTMEEVLAGGPSTPEFNLLATWKLTNMKIDGLTAIFGDCHRNTTFTFLNNNSFSALQYDDNWSDCESTSLSGMWEQESATSYSLTTSGGVPMNVDVVNATNITLSYNEEVSWGEQLVEITLTKQ